MTDENPNDGTIDTRDRVEIDREALGTLIEEARFHLEHLEGNRRDDVEDAIEVAESAHGLE